jgi:two-component system, chemotaxis family, CheB/CheR fusion protein
MLISVGAGQTAMAIRQKRMEEKRIFLLELEREAHQEEERESRLRDDFFALVSHELRTPLNSVLGWTEILRRSRSEAVLRVQALDAIERGVSAQTLLIEDLLDVSSIISGKLRIDAHILELMPVLQEAIEIAQSQAEAKCIRIQSFLNPDIGFIKGDPPRLARVFRNILSNAIKFTPKGGTIWVRLELRHSHAVVRIKDTGQGIAPELLPNVFNGFNHKDSSRMRSQGGLGFGLAIVKHLVKLHGGRTYARSLGEGKGSTFSVHLPIAANRENSFDTKSSASAKVRFGQIRAGIELENVRLLIVEGTATLAKCYGSRFRDMAR